MTTRSEILQKIIEERERQVKIGWSESHDSWHCEHSWVPILDDIYSQISSAANVISMYRSESEEGRAEIKKRLIQLCAVSVAWIEAMDKEEKCPNDKPRTLIESGTLSTSNM